MPYAGRDADLFLLLQERHHLAQLRADLFDRLAFLRRFAHRQELLAAGLVLADPLLRELAGLNLAPESSSSPRASVR